MVNVRLRNAIPLLVLAEQMSCTAQTVLSSLYLRSVLATSFSMGISLPRLPCERSSRLRDYGSARAARLSAGAVSVTKLRGVHRDGHDRKAPVRDSHLEHLRACDVGGGARSPMEVGVSSVSLRGRPSPFCHQSLRPLRSASAPVGKSGVVQPAAFARSVTLCRSQASQNSAL